MLVPWAALNSQYLNTAQHANGGERNRRRLSVEEYRAGTEASFRLYGFLLTNVAAFKYLGRILRARDFDCLAVVATLRKSINKWERMYRILGREGEHEQIPGKLLKAVVQVVPLFGLETWVVTPRIRIMLGELHYRVPHRMMDKKPWRLPDGGRGYIPWGRQQGRPDWSRWRHT